MNLVNVLSLTAYITQYDQMAKDILTNDRILAKILQCLFKAYASFSIDEIIERFIMHIPNKEKMLELRNEIKGKIKFDTLTYVLHPNPNIRGMYINIEAQKNSLPLKIMGNRNMYYVGHGLAMQKGNGYENLDKFVSIWIVFNPRIDQQNTSYVVEQEIKQLYGNVKIDESIYDKMNVVVNNLGKEINRENELLEILGIIYSMELSGDDKYEQLFKIDPMLVDEELKEGLDEMCNLGLLVFEDGFENGIEKGRGEGRSEGMTLGASNATFNNILSIMESFHVNFQQAMTSLKITNEEEKKMYQERYDALNH